MWAFGIEPPIRTLNSTFDFLNVDVHVTQVKSSLTQCVCSICGDGRPVEGVHRSSCDGHQDGSKVRVNCTVCVWGGHL